MKTVRTLSKSMALHWALVGGLFASLLPGLSLGFDNSSDRVAIRPEAINQSPNSWNHPEYTSPSAPMTRPNGVFPTSTFPTSPSQNGPGYDGFPYGSSPSAPAPIRQEPTIDDKLNSRYTDPRMLRFLSSTSMNQLTSMYMEASKLIDQRHVNPIGYEQRTQRALANLSRAIENPAFMNAVRANGNPANVRQAQAELSGLQNRQPARSAQEAISVMQYAASVLNRSVGVPMEATALEFIHGTIDSLDQFSAYVPAATAQRPSAALEEHIVGIGVELKAHDTGLQIVGVVEGGPAAAAKLQRGDIIVAINNRQLAGMSLNEGADLITGPAGTTVNLTVVRNGQSGTVTLPRRSVYVSSVTSVQMIDPQQKVGYLRLKQFSESTSKDLDQALWKLYNEGMQTLVLDLRGNPGGLLTTAIEVSDKFITNGTIVSTKGRTAEDNSVEVAKFDRTWKTPLVVLIDENSASASEIFAAAIQDHGRGVIVGRRSYGKGTVQTHFPMRSVAGDLKLTTANFYAPSGRQMAGSGVTPDVNVPASQGGLDFSPERDGDIITAIRLAGDGRLAEMAARAGSPQNHSQGVSQFSL